MKALLIFLLSALLLSASDTSNLQVKILEKIISDVTLNKSLAEWSDDKGILDRLKSHSRLIVKNRCEDANIIILKDKANLTKECTSKHIFVLNYQLLSDIPQSFGALFWKKGRPNIVILNPRIKAQSIQISNNLKPYLEEKVW